MSEEEQLLLERVDSSKVEAFTRSSKGKSATSGGSRLSAAGRKKETGTSDGKRKLSRRMKCILLWQCLLLIDVIINNTPIYPSKQKMARL